MAESIEPIEPIEPMEPTSELARRRAPDPLALVVGVASIAVAIMAFVGVVLVLPGFDPRWLLAAGAVVVGLLLLGATVRRRR